MTRQQHVVIVGGGVIGLLTTFNLASEVQSVVLLDRSNVGQEASWAGGGIVSPLYPWRYSPAVTALAHWSQDFYPQLGARLFAATGVDPEVHTTGLYWLDLDDEAEALAWALREHRPLRAVDLSAVHDAVPVLGPGFSRAIYMADVANVRNPRLVKSLKAALLALPNVTVHEQCEVREFIREGEQVVGVRGDPRSDIFAMGVMLYQLATGELPFGAPLTRGGLRQRLWMDPVPPRQRRPDLPEWLQEVILRCLEPEADKRYPSAAHLAFDLRHPEQITVTERGRKTQGTGFVTHLKRWIKAVGMHYQPSLLPTRQIEAVPIIMVAVSHKNVTDATLYSLRQAVARSLGTRPGARLACVTVVAPSQAGTTQDATSETSVHRRYLASLRQWAQALDLQSHQASYHVLESSDTAQALLDYATGNHVSLIVMGAATHGLKMQRFMATVPTKVAVAAPCTVILVKQALPFERLVEQTEKLSPAWNPDRDAPF